MVDVESAAGACHRQMGAGFVEEEDLFRADLFRADLFREREPVGAMLSPQAEASSRVLVDLSLPGDA